MEEEEHEADDQLALPQMEFRLGFNHISNAYTEELADVVRERQKSGDRCQHIDDLHKHRLHNRHVDEVLLVQLRSIKVVSYALLQRPVLILLIDVTNDRHHVLYGNRRVRAVLPKALLLRNPASPIGVTPCSVQICYSDVLISDTTEQRT